MKVNFNELILLKVKKWINLFNDSVKFLEELDPEKATGTIKLKVLPVEIKEDRSFTALVGTKEKPEGCMKDDVDMVILYNKAGHTYPIMRVDFIDRMKSTKDSDLSSFVIDKGFQTMCFKHNDVREFMKHE